MLAQVLFVFAVLMQALLFGGSVWGAVCGACDVAGANFVRLTAGAACSLGGWCKCCFGLLFEVLAPGAGASFQIVENI